jgi:putative membrane protein
MMFWYGDGLTGWGSPAMAMGMGMVLVWWLVGLGVYALVRRLHRGDRPAAPRPTPEQVLAERFARGDIDETEYRRRFDVLAGDPRPVGKP